jgi:acetate kinase
MTAARPRILAINGGSSSIRFALYEVGSALERRLHGKVERIGLAGTTLTLIDPGRDVPPSRSDIASDRAAAVNALIDRLEAEGGLASLAAVGHRIVHGMEHTEPERIGARLLAELRRLAPDDPDHLPLEIALIEAFRQRHPPLPQLACFDTAFHRTLPRVARLLAIPRRYEAQGVRRYGFHGLSYAYLMQELRRLGDPAATSGRVILAHLGNGASLAAVRDGRSIDTSMGFTPASGLPMSTRAGDLDPGLLGHFSRSEQMTAARFDRMVNHESGLLGISETSSDVRDLLERVATDVRAAEAVALFCYQVRKCIGAFATVLCGVDTLVFSGGIGENAALIREQICDGLGFLGIELDRERNASHAEIISAEAGRVRVRVIRTDEELMIAGSVARALSLSTGQDAGP